MIFPPFKKNTHAAEVIFYRCFLKYEVACTFFNFFFNKAVLLILQNLYSWRGVGRG